MYQPSTDIIDSHLLKKQDNDQKETAELTVFWVVQKKKLVPSGGMFFSVDVALLVCAILCHVL